ncbi:unnamed protein product [Paramecium sonneborni]|uniref:LRAT domain-containing protein n=1 Tax=Paramecium sonneborni TaxID=65129 RepID=A0A8S1NSL5_9CILI|nr:unnamed protein product [Paramecium sonneborni]
MSNSFQSGENSQRLNLEDEERIIQNIGDAIKVKVYSCHLNIDQTSIIQYGTKLVSFAISAALLSVSNTIGQLALDIGENFEVEHEFLVIKCVNGYIRFDWGPYGLKIKLSQFKSRLFTANENARPKWNLLKSWKVRFRYGKQLRKIVEMMQQILEAERFKYDALNFNCKHFTRMMFCWCQDKAK